LNSHKNNDGKGKKPCSPDLAGLTPGGKGYRGYSKSLGSLGPLHDNPFASGSTSYCNKGEKTAPQAPNEEKPEPGKHAEFRLLPDGSMVADVPMEHMVPGGDGILYYDPEGKMKARNAAAQQVREQLPMSPEMEEYVRLMRGRSSSDYAAEWEKGNQSIKPDANMTPEELERLKKAAGSLNPFNFSRFPKDIGLSPKQIISRYIDRWKIKKALDKGPSLDEKGKEEIAKAVGERIGDVGQDGKTIGDIVGEEVGKYLARKAQPAVQTGESRMDPEAAIRILDRHVGAMARYAIQSEMGFINPGQVLAENPAAPVLAALAAIPAHRLDERVLPYSTARGLLENVAKYTLHESVRAAALELLGK